MKDARCESDGGSLASEALVLECLYLKDGVSNCWREAQFLDSPNT